MSLLSKATHAGLHPDSARKNDATTDDDTHSVSSTTPLARTGHNRSRSRSLLDMDSLSSSSTHHRVVPPLPAASFSQRILTFASLGRTKTTLMAITPAQLSELHDPKLLKALLNLGGLTALTNLLQSDIEKGLDDTDEKDRKRRIDSFGTNRLPLRITKGIFRLIFEAFKDKILILLSVAAIVSLALGLYETLGEPPQLDVEGNQLPQVDWVEGVAILAAVVIVVLVGAVNDYQKERQFSKLNAKKEDRELVVIRNGQQKVISIYDLLVGDVVTLQTGDVAPADAVLILGRVECDESALLGESDSIIKVPAAEALQEYQDHCPTTEDIGSQKIAFGDPYLISGATVLSGFGHALVTAVGQNSIHGRTMQSLNTEAEVTPLQLRLDNLAGGISKYAFLAGLVLFVVLFIRYCVQIAPRGSQHDALAAAKGSKFLDIFITAITIIVVAVPEGLPLAVTLALAFATTRMAQNGNLVRVLRSCETMGGATAICSDKTGTLTENRMRVVRGFLGLEAKLNSPFAFDEQELLQEKDMAVPQSDAVIPNIHPELNMALAENICLNSTAFENAAYDPEKAQQLKSRPTKKSFADIFMGKSRGANYNQTMSEMASQGVSEPFLGNKTEAALLTFAKDKLTLFDEKALSDIRLSRKLDIVQVIPFESLRKWAGVVIKTPEGYRLYVKGAAELLFKACGYQFNSSGEVVPLARPLRDICMSKIDEYAMDALRAIALGHCDFNDITSWPPAGMGLEEDKPAANPDMLLDFNTTKDVVLDAIVGIQDPIKKGVPEAVLRCKQAGVSVRMLTGDNLITAKAISLNCHILTPEDSSNEYAFMEGPAFRALLEKDRVAIAPKLRVLARSSPEDKRILVKTLRDAGEVVAVTGDGTNDAPALKLADVGFSMGICGTEVAREASDIILMTDDFTDIVQAIKWGRTVATSIKKFIQFQLTVNITACVLTFVSAVASTENKSVLTAVQLLWVNLIMDSLAALALATDKPDDSMLQRKPLGRKLALISTGMWKMILGQSVMQLIVTFVLHFAGAKIWFGSGHHSVHQEAQIAALTFNTFVWLQFWKLVVTRKLDEADDITTVRGRITRNNLDFSQDLFRNWYFIAIALIIAGCQILIMFVGGAAFSVMKQTGSQWATALICGFISIPTGALLRIIPNTWCEAIFPTKAFNSLCFYGGLHFLKSANRKQRRQHKLELSSDFDVAESKV